MCVFNFSVALPDYHVCILFWIHQGRTSRKQNCWLSHTSEWARKGGEEEETAKRREKQIVYVPNVIARNDFVWESEKAKATSARAVSRSDENIEQNVSSSHFVCVCVCFFSPFFNIHENWRNHKMFRAHWEKKKKIGITSWEFVWDANYVNLDELIEYNDSLLFVCVRSHTIVCVE